VHTGGGSYVLFITDFTVYMFYRLSLVHVAAGTRYDEITITEHWVMKTLSD